MRLWVLLALISVFFVGMFNFLIASSHKNLPESNIIYKQIFILSVLSISGLLAFILLLIYKILYNEKINKFYSKTSKIKYYHILVPSILIIIYLNLDIISLTMGGGIVTSILGLSTFLTIILGYIFNNDKINSRIIVGIILVLFVTALIIMESIKINKT